MSATVFNALRTVARVLPASSRSAGFVAKTATRSLWSASPTSSVMPLLDSKSSKKLCLCGNCRGLHTQGDRELVDFLVEEITAEKRNSKQQSITSIDGFEIKVDGAQINLSKKFNDELVEITMNVNHSVDADFQEGELNTKADNPPQPEMKSRPNFEIRLTKGKKTTQFACSFIQESTETMDDGPNDIFSIDEMMVYEGESHDKTYAVAGEILDGYMYDLLMNLLEERGVSNEFVEKLSSFATKREHDLYVGLLESLKSFVQG